MENLTEEQWLENLIEVIGALANLDFSRKALTDTSDNPLNTIAVGLNMLAEELESSVVSKTQMEEKNVQLEKLAEAQKQAIAQMSTPIARLWEGILLLPLVGMLTVERVKEVLINILENIVQSQAKVFILDISGVGVIDSYSANHFVKIAKATRLMGCTCILSGISPEVAQTMVELGVSIDEIETTGTMKDALERSFRYTGFNLSKSNG